MKESVAGAVVGLIDVEDFLARTHLVVMPAPEEVAVNLLADRLGLPAASCVAHQAILCGKLARLADENGVRTADAPAELSASDIALLLDDVNEAIDPSALEAAVREGVAELVDFATPIDEARFFSGVDVVVGHVVAGLPVERPEVDRLLDGLAARRLALAIGPSGAGKSALIWLTAYASRHSVRWYRVRRLHADDVPALVRLVKGLSPTGANVGFVVDDLGRDDRAGIDHLVEEMRNQPMVNLLGACREEDLFVVRTAHEAVQVRPRLTPELAERIWRELRYRGETSLPEWRESFERSEGLLLEYSHLLTEGTRLAETIAAQVDRRVREQRALELDALCVVATADAYGAEIAVTRLTAKLAVDATQMKLALARLVDEHLIREHDGRLAGLHELRSRYVMEEVHRLPPPILADSLRRVIDLLTGPALQPFLIRVLLEGPVVDEVVIEALAARLKREPDPRALAAVLHALRLVGFRRMAAELREILVAEGVGPAHVGMVATFAIGSSEHEILPAPIQRAIKRFRELTPGDLRDNLLTRIAPKIVFALSASADIRTAAMVLAALGEAEVSVPIEATALARIADGASLSDTRLLLEAAHAGPAGLAVAVASQLGGSTALLARLEREQPWVRDARVGLSDDGRVKAQAEYAYVAESAQPDAHGAVVELARYLAALAPEADTAVCRAIDATGETAGFGVPLADKAIDRDNLPSQIAIAWNRARIRAATAAVALSTETAYLLAARDVVIRSTRLVRRAGDAWARGKSPTRQLIEDATSLAAAANMLAPAPIAIETVEPLDEGEVPPLSDAASVIGTMIATNLFPNLFNGASVAPLIPQIVEQTDKLAEPEYWHLLDESPLAELSTLRQTLLDLRAVVAEQTRSVALRASGGNRLVMAANVARDRASRRMQAIGEQLERMLGDASLSARVLHCERATDLSRWPSEDFVVLVELPTIYDWHPNLESIVNICKPPLAGGGRPPPGLPR